MLLTRKTALLYVARVEQTNAIKRASDLVGGRVALARLIQVSPSYVSQLIAGARPLPVERCPEIERATSGAVTRRDLRPADWWLIWPELVTDDHPAPAAGSDQAMAEEGAA